MKNIVNEIIDLSLNNIMDLSIKVTENSVEKCNWFGIYESQFPEEFENEEDEIY